MNFSKLAYFLFFQIFLFAPFSVSGKVTIETAKAVTEKIYSKTGITNRKIPVLELVKDKKFMAEYDAIDNKIRIGIDVFTVCNTLGAHDENALAVIVGHEMDHFFKDPDSDNHFAKFSTYLFVANALKESQADINGLFYAYLAGYTEAGAVYDDLIKALYEHFHLSERMKGYPPLSERLKTNEEIKVKAANLYTAFEMGNYLSLIGYYEKAIACYEFVLETYQGAELNNNLGVSLFLSMIDSKQLDGFYYPLELMGSSQLKNIRSDSGLSSIAETKLKNAARYFDKSLEVSPSNMNALLGKISIGVLLGNFQQAYSEIDLQIAAAPSNNYKGKLEIIKAIALIKQGGGNSEEQGLELLKQLQKNEDPEVSGFANRNLHFAKYQELEKIQVEECKFRQPDVIDKIDSKTDFYPYLQKNTFSVIGLTEYVVSSQQLSTNSKLSVIQDKGGYSRPLAFQELAKYRVDPNQFASSIQWRSGMGDYVYLPACNLIFRKGDNGKTVCIKIFQ